tara:strand:+ start:331 stop:585 length:255 start_codon:yes stop_codon:yes gene_type:complete
MKEDNKIVMMTDSGYTVIDRREICAITLVGMKGEDVVDRSVENDWDTLEIHLNSGTIFSTSEMAIVEELWFRSRWSAGVWEVEE